MPLRIKLIAAVLALVTAALAVISVAGIGFLRGYLLRQADRELRDAAVNARPSTIVYSYLFLNAGQAQIDYGGLSIQWLPATGHARQVIAEYFGYQSGLPHMVPPPAVSRSDSWLETPGTPGRGAFSWLNTPGAPVSAPVTVSAVSGAGRWRVVSSAAAFRGPSGRVRGTIIVGIDVTGVYRTISELTTIDVIISCGLLLVLAVAGITLIRRSLRPLRDIERTAGAIAAGDLGRRVPDRDPRTEVGRLGRSLNAMLVHIEAAFRAQAASEEAARRSEDRMRQFVADASHELRTPLTAIRGFAEYYRQRGGVAAEPSGSGPVTARNPPPRSGQPGDVPAYTVTGPLSPADLDRLMERAESEAVRMGVLVDDMLQLARLDQKRPLDFRAVDLLAITADAVHDARVIAPQRSINLTLRTAEAPLVTGDEVGIRQALGNLISNAMTHTPDGTPIDVTLRAGTLRSDQRPAGPGPTATALRHGRAVPGSPRHPGLPGEPAIIIEVTDQGQGLTAEQKDHVFERFYRADSARSRPAGGTGLGLAIVAALINAHHGDVWVNSEPGHGATFGVALPLAPEARLD